MTIHFPHTMTSLLKNQKKISTSMTSQKRARLRTNPIRIDVTACYVVTASFVVIDLMYLINFIQMFLTFFNILYTLLFVELKNISAQNIWPKDLVHEKTVVIEWQTPWSPFNVLPGQESSLLKNIC